MPPVVIDNPILNSPFAELARHFRFDDDGITSEIAQGRRRSTYFIPIPKPKVRGGGQIAFAGDFATEQARDNDFINRVREHVGAWRSARYPGITAVTRELLAYWTEPAREKALFFCQVEALETAIFLAEVAGHRQPWIENKLREDSQARNPGLYRVAFKMATGSGKTVVMAMLIAWQALNKLANPQDKRFSETFLVVTPGITIRDRLQVLRPNLQGNYYQERDLLTPDQLHALQAAKIEIANFHGFRVVADGPEDLVNAPAPIEDSGRFVETILDNLRASGVDNRTKGERLRFETLDPYPGRFLQATGTFREGETDRRVAVANGPQYGTVGPDLVREAALETGGYFDVLVVCGFAFDALADEAGGTAMRFGKLTVLTARMNPDLAMAEELLKKTRTGNLFTVFGQPDIDIRPAAGGAVTAGTGGEAGGAGDLQVEIHGLDVYDPTIGVVRSDSTDDIACWFIDTAYDDQQFFVRHAYFLGVDDPYDKLKRALRADIDEAAWASLNSTVSRPFPRPASGRIAVKVINHYGDEILKVYGV